MSNGLRVLLAIVLAILLAMAWRVFVDREPLPFAPPPPDAAADAAPPALPAKVTLRKCVDAAGATSIQSAPCPAGSRTVWTREATPEADGAPSTEIVLDDAVDRGGDGTPVDFACRIARGNRAAYRAGETGPVTREGLELHDRTVESTCP